LDNRLNLVVNFAEKGLDQLQGGLKNLVGLGKSGSRALRDMARDGRALERELAGVRRELKDASGNVTELANRERDLERAVEKANAALKRQAALNKIDDRAAAIRARGQELVGRGRANVTQGAAMLAPLLLAGKAGADFSSTMVDIQQKAELSDEAAARLRNNILAAARASKQLPDQMAAAVDTLAGLGLTPEEAVKAAAPMGKFMTAFKVEGTDAAASVYAGMKSLEIPLARTTKLLDMMAAGGNQGAFEARDMARAFPGLTAQLKAMGQSGEKAGAELVAALEVVRRGTGSSDEAATNMQNLLAKLTATTTLKQFEKKGIDAFAAIKNGIEQGVSPLETMIALTRKATAGDKMRIGELFPDMQAQQAMRQLMLDYEDFVKMRGEIAGADGVTLRAFDQRVANDQTVQLRELGGAMANLALSVAPVLLPFLRQATTYLTTAANAVAGWAREHPAAAGMLLKLFAAMAVGKIAIGGLQMAFGGLLGPMATGYKLWQQYKLLGSVAAVFPKAAAAVRVLGLAFRFLLGPIGLILTVVGLLAYAIYANWDTITAAFHAGVAKVKGFMSGLPDWMKTLGKTMMTGLLMAFNPAFLATKLIAMAKGGIAAFKSYLGIKSPSRVFMAMGGHVAGGLALGIDRKQSQAFASARRLAAGVAGAAALSTGAPLAASGGGGAGAAQGASSAAPITIQIYQQPGESGEDLAQRVKKLLEDEERKRRGSGFGDD